MKITELMIDNWVKVQNSYIQVCENRGGCIIDKYFNIYKDENVISPIPITEELLKKNGFIHKCIIKPDKYYPEGLFEWEKEVEGCWVTLSVGSNKIGCDWRLHVDNCDRDSICNIDIQYVHQLQNVFNILGIEMEVVV